MQKVVAMGMPWVLRKVLYCMEQMKLITTWVMAKGVLSGSRPRKTTATISTKIRRVSQRIQPSYSMVEEAASDKTDPRK